MKWVKWIRFSPPPKMLLSRVVGWLVVEGRVWGWGQEVWGWVWLGKTVWVEEVVGDAVVEQVKFASLSTPVEGMLTKPGLSLPVMLLIQSMYSDTRVKTPKTLDLGQSSPKLTIPITAKLRSTKATRALPESPCGKKATIVVETVSVSAASVITH